MEFFSGMVATIATFDGMLLSMVLLVLSVHVVETVPFNIMLDDIQHDAQGKQVTHVPIKTKRKHQEEGLQPLLLPTLRNLAPLRGEEAKTCIGGYSFLRYNV